MLVFFTGIWKLQAHRLPIQVYTTAQGLPRNSVLCLVPDASGLLWICTSEGLARFDGSEFRTFGREQGLPSVVVLNFLVSRKGGYWLVTDAGVCRLPPASKVGETCRLLSVDGMEGEFQLDALVESSDGRIWTATDKAVYRSSADGKRLERTALPLPGEPIASLGAAPDGRLVVSTNRAVYLWDGNAYRRISSMPVPGCGFGRIYVAAPRDIWVEGSCNIYRVAGWDSAAGPRLEPVPLGGAVSGSHVLLRHDRSVWWTARSGLLHLEQQPDGSLRERERFTAAEGLPSPWVTHLVEDAQGSLWGATEGLGIFRITTTGFRVYYGEDGLGSARIGSIFEDLRGDLCVTTTVLDETRSRSNFRVKNGDRFERIDFRQSPQFHNWGWGWNQVALQAHDGEWWFQTDRGVYRFPSVSRPQSLDGVAPSQVYGSGTGLGEDEVFRIFEDSHGDLWMSTVSPRNELIRWERATGTFHSWTVADGWPPDALATAIRESANGTLWFGTFGDVVRFRNGRFEKLAIPSAPVLSVVRDLYIDRAGRVWVATARNGLFRCDNPDDAAPVFRHYGAHDGLSSDSTRGVTEDDFGFIYLGTARAVDRIDPRAPIGGRNILHYTAADGLPEGEQDVVYRDRRGHLWFGTLDGLAEYDPAQPAVRSIPDVYIRRVRVRGEEVALPWEGTHNFTIHLRPDENQVEIEYAGIDLRSAASLRYQYRTSGVDSDWSQPATRFSVNYASLPPGTHVFQVRAVGADGTVGAGAAALTMALEAPLWRRSWFLAIAAALLAAIIYWAYTYRLRHFLAMERLRIRIATDLHDDIGASLTQISLLSEVGRRDLSRDTLGEVAGIARDLVQEMSDIVWAVSPRHDRFDSMVHRMRAFAEDAMADGELVFDISELPADLPLPLEYRRPLYLAFKEAVNNVSRHAAATRLTVRVAAKDGSIQLTVEDNGCGFDPAESPGGEGLASIRRRIRDLQGTVAWESVPGQGTRFTAVLPLRARRSLRTLAGSPWWLKRLR
jgi:signal transduction histidine kinase/ligand-binding sensor domain-containing protein